MNRSLTLKNKQQLVLNSELELGESEGKGKGRFFTSRFLEPGIAHYEELGDILITKETLNKFVHTMVGAPVIIDHEDVTDKNVDKLRVGVISRVWFNEFDGWFYCEGILTDNEAIDLIKNQGWNVSCAYSFESIPKGMHNGKKIDLEFVDGEFLHLAIVKNPRYEGANIVVNSKEEQPRDEKGRWTNKTGNEYFDNNENTKIVEMTPDEYINKSSEGLGISVEEIIESRKNKNLEKIKEKFENGEQFNIPYLHYQNDDFNQDGLHRAIAVKELGDKKLPVAILDERINNAKNNIGDITMTVLNDLTDFIKNVVSNEKDEEMKEVKNEDKRKLIDEIGGILKDKVDDEIIRTVIKKAEELSYEPSEDDKADNKAKNEDDKEDKEEAKNKCKNEEDKKEEEKDDKVTENEEEDKKEDKKEDKEDKAENKKVKNSMKDIVMGGNTQVQEQKLYTSRKERLEEGNKY